MSYKTKTYFIHFSHIHTHLNIIDHHQCNKGFNIILNKKYTVIVVGWSNIYY